MGDVDRRGFMRILRRSDPAEGEGDGALEPAEPSPKDLQFAEMAEMSLSLLRSVEEKEDEPVAEGPCYTRAYDVAYMRVTAAHVVFSVVTGFSNFAAVGDVRRLDVEPPVELPGYGSMVIAVLHSHHPADPEQITRSNSFRFRADSPLPAAIRSACGLPEPVEEEPEEPPEAGGESAPVQPLQPPM